MRLTEKGFEQHEIPAVAGQTGGHIINLTAKVPIQYSYFISSIFHRSNAEFFHPIRYIQCTDLPYSP